MQLMKKVRLLMSHFGEKSRNQIKSTATRNFTPVDHVAKVCEPCHDLGIFTAPPVHGQNKLLGIKLPMRISADYPWWSMHAYPTKPARVANVIIRIHPLAQCEIACFCVYLTIICTPLANLTFPTTTTTTTTEYKTLGQFNCAEPTSSVSLKLTYQFYLENSEMTPPPAIAINAPEVGATYGTNYKSDPSFYAPVDFKKNGVDIAEATKYPPPNQSNPNFN